MDKEIHINQLNLCMFEHSFTDYLTDLLSDSNNYGFTLHKGFDNILSLAEFSSGNKHLIYSRLLGPKPTTSAVKVQWLTYALQNSFYHCINFYL